MVEFYHRYQNSIDRVLFFAFITVSVFVFFQALFPYLGPFFFGLLIALMMNPLINIVMKRIRLGRWLASIVALLIFLVVVSSLGTWLVTTLVRQVGAFINNMPQHIEEMARRLEDGNLWLERASGHLPDGMNLPDMQGLGMAAFSAFMEGGMAGQALLVVGGVPYIIVSIILALVSAYFFMADRERIFGLMKRVCPPWIKRQWLITRAGLSKAMAGYFRAQAILMVLVGLICIAGLLILDNEYALLLGLLLAVLDFVPMLGPAMVLLPWALICFLTGDIHLGIGILVIYAVITILRQVLQPKIMGAQMGIHPLAAIMSIYIGFRIFGIIGFFLGPSLLMILMAVKEADQDALN